MPHIHAHVLSTIWLTRSHLHGVQLGLHLFGDVGGADPVDEVAGALSLEGVSNAAGATAAAVSEVSSVAKEWIGMWGGGSPSRGRSRGL